MGLIRLALVPLSLVGVLCTLLIPCYVVMDRGTDPRYAADDSKETIPNGMEVVVVEGHDGLPLNVIRSVGFDSDADATRVVFLHGFPDNYRSFDHQLQEFHGTLGCEVASIAMRGYSPQAIPRDGDMTLVAAARDVIAVLRSSGVSSGSQSNPRRFHVVGHDWGSAVAQVAVRLEPSLFESLTIAAVPDLTKMNLKMAVSNPKQLLHSWYIFFFQLPVLPEMWLEHGKAVQWLWNAWGSVPYSRSRLTSTKETFYNAEVRRTALAMYRQSMIPILLGPAVAQLMGQRARELWDVLARPIAVPKLALVGQSDQCMLVSTFDATMGDWIASGGTLEVVEGGHFFHAEPGNEKGLSEHWRRSFGRMGDARAEVTPE